MIRVASNPVIGGLIRKTQTHGAKGMAQVVGKAEARRGSPTGFRESTV